MTPTKVSDAVFHTRVRNEKIEGPNPCEWKDVTSDEIFAGKKVVLFALPDGSGEFTRKMDMLAERFGQRMGMRSWRYSIYVEDGTIRQLCAKPGFQDNPPGVAVKVSDAETMLNYRKSLK